MASDGGDDGGVVTAARARHTGRVAASRRRRRVAVGAGAVAVLGVAIGAGVAAGGGGGSAPAPSSSASGHVATWFAAASGPGCRPAPSTAAVAGAVGAVACTPPGIHALFAELRGTDDAAGYLAGEDHSHTGAVLTAWTSGRANEAGDVVFYVSKTDSTIVWGYRGSRYVGKASASSLQALEAWWTATGRSVVPGATP